MLKNVSFKTFAAATIVAIVMTSCSNSQSSTPTTQVKLTTTSSTTTVKPGPTWKTVVPEDVFTAPFAQEVCDLLRSWRPPAETSAEQFELLSRATASLEKFILSSNSQTYLTISVIASGAIDYEKRYPNDSVFPITFSLSLDECNLLGFTSENSKWGFDTATGTLKGG